ncbi:hypothetical protein [Streptomyces omiyaensis]|uniref:hypothetical protein n=1 Tax=Streptomyces omiyaensis TaxID=68247 RepID=UPI001671BCEC|nr:hypothetical protein [Streptomyces omiyaensis]
MDTKITEKPEETASGPDAGSAAADDSTTARRAEAADSADDADTDVTGSQDDADDANSLADGTDEADETDEARESDESDAESSAPQATGIGAGAAAVVSAALSVVALTGSWAGRVVSERETLIGQIKTSGTGTPAEQISEIYGDAWHSVALVNGVFALLALLLGVLVLALALGGPRQPAWVRAVAVAGAVLGGLGLLLSVGAYFDLFLGLPTAGS